MNNYAQAAAKLGVSTRTLARYIKRRIIAVVQIGRGKITDDEIARVIAKRTRKAIV
jgi:predicted site-specific integrase-resolvase